MRPSNTTENVFSVLAQSRLRVWLGLALLLCPVLALAGAHSVGAYLAACCLMWLGWTCLAGLFAIGFALTGRAPKKRAGGGVPVGFFAGRAEFFRPFFGRAHERGHGLYAAASFATYGLVTLGAQRALVAFQGDALYLTARDMNVMDLQFFVAMPAVLCGAVLLYRAAGPLCRGDFRQQLGTTPLHLWFRASVAPIPAKAPSLMRRLVVVVVLATPGLVWTGAHPVVTLALAAAFALCFWRLRRQTAADRTAWQCA